MHSEWQIKDFYQRYWLRHWGFLGGWLDAAILHQYQASTSIGHHQSNWPISSCKNLWYPLVRSVAFAVESPLSQLLTIHHQLAYPWLHLVSKNHHQSKSYPLWDLLVALTVSDKPLPDQRLQLLRWRISGDSAPAAPRGTPRQRLGRPRSPPAHAQLGGWWWQGIAPRHQLVVLVESIWWWCILGGWWAWRVESTTLS